MLAVQSVVQSIRVKRLLIRVSQKLIICLPAAAIINITITFNLIAAVILAVVNLNNITAVN